MNPGLLLDNHAPLFWALGGGLLGLVACLLQWIQGKGLGISTSFENICSLASRIPYFDRSELRGPGAWRLPMVAGLILGGVCSSLQGGGWEFSWNMGTFDQVIGIGPLGKIVWMFAGGLLVGFGTRLAGGCTSGHGIYGLGNLEKSSLVATLSYFGAGIITTQFIFRVLFPVEGLF